MNNIKNANLYPRNTVAKAYINMPIKSFFVYHNLLKKFSIIVLLYKCPLGLG